jgi:hypothetical protein
MCSNVKCEGVKREARVFTLGLLVLALMVSGCGKKPASLTDVFPGLDTRR